MLVAGATAGDGGGSLGSAVSIKGKRQLEAEEAVVARGDTLASNTYQLMIVKADPQEPLGVVVAAPRVDADDEHNLPAKVNDASAKSRKWHGHGHDGCWPNLPP